MIKISEDFYIRVDADTSTGEYTLMKEVIGKPNEQGESNITYKALAYTGSMKEALLAFRRRMIAEHLKGADMTLPEALRCIQKIDEDFRTLLEEVLPYDPA